MSTFRCRPSSQWWAVAVPFAATVLAAVATWIALAVRHYTDTVLLVALAVTMLAVGVRNLRALR